jgi:hypothetical protein
VNAGFFGPFLLGSAAVPGKGQGYASEIDAEVTGVEFLVTRSLRGRSSLKSA